MKRNKWKLLGTALIAALMLPIMPQAAPGDAQIRHVFPSSWDEIVAAAEAKEPCTVVLQKDITSEYDFAPGLFPEKNFILDLNGHTITVKETATVAEEGYYDYSYRALLGTGYGDDTEYFDFSIQDSSANKTGEFIFESVTPRDETVLAIGDSNFSRLYLQDGINFSLITNAKKGVAVRGGSRGTTSVGDVSLSVSAKETAIGVDFINSGIGFGDCYLNGTSIYANSQEAVGIYVDHTQHHDGGGGTNVWIRNAQIFVNSEGGEGLCFGFIDETGKHIYPNGPKYKTLSDVLGKYFGIRVADGFIYTTEEYSHIDAHNITGSSCELIADYLPENPFTDVKGSEWYSADIRKIRQTGLMTGMDDTHFAPLKTLSRCQFAQVLYRLNGSPKVAFQPYFPDVKDGQWYTEASIWAKEAGVIKGYDNGKFGPTDSITREQMVTILFRNSGHTDAEYETAAYAKLLDKFSDGKRVSAFAKSAMKWAVSEGIITGTKDGRLNPQGKTTRAEAAAVMNRYMK